MTRRIDPGLKLRNRQRRTYYAWWAKKPFWPHGEGHLDRPRRPLDVRDGLKIAELQQEINDLTETLLWINTAAREKKVRNATAKRVREILDARMPKWFNEMGIR